MHLYGGQAELSGIDPLGCITKELEIVMHDNGTEVQTHAQELDR